MTRVGAGGRLLGSVFASSARGRIWQLSVRKTLSGRMKHMSRLCSFRLFAADGTTS